MGPSLRAFLWSASILALAGCGGDDHPRPPNPDLTWHPAAAMLSTYDANHDGIVTRAEMEAGLKRDFNTADTDRDGKLNPDEARTVNQQRLSFDQSTASPLVDWNQDGFIEFQEFATTPRSLFDQLDRNGDGKLTPDELSAGQPKPPPQQKPMPSYTSRSDGGG